MQSYILQIFEYTYLKQYDLMIKYLLLSPNHIHYLGLSASIVDILNQINYNLKLIPLPVQLARYLPSRSGALSSDTSMDKDAANGALRQEMGQLRQQVQCVCSDDECVICDV